MIDAYEEPGEPDRRGGGRYLWWLVRCQPGRSLAAAVLGSVWMVLLAATPYLLSRAIDDGLEPGDFPALAGWTAALEQAPTVPPATTAIAAATPVRRRRSVTLISRAPHLD